MVLAFLSLVFLWQQNRRYLWHWLSLLLHLQLLRLLVLPEVAENGNLLALLVGLGGLGAGLEKMQGLPVFPVMINQRVRVILVVVTY